MDRASDSGSECWGFESLRAYHVGAKSALLRRLFMPAAKKPSSALRAAFFIPNKNIGFNRPLHAGANVISFAPTFLQKSAYLIQRLRFFLAFGPSGTSQSTLSRLILALVVYCIRHNTVRGGIAMGGQGSQQEQKQLCVGLLNQIR